MAELKGFHNMDSYPDPELKKKFLNSATRMQGRIIKEMVKEGILVDGEASSNQGGIAVSGESYGTYWLSEDDAIHLCITASSFSGRGLTIYAQLRQVRPEDKRRAGRSKKRPYPSQDLGSNINFPSGKSVTDETMKEFVKSCIMMHPSYGQAKARLEATKLLDKAAVVQHKTGDIQAL